MEAKRERLWSRYLGLLEVRRTAEITESTPGQGGTTLAPRDSIYSSRQDDQPRMVREVRAGRRKRRVWQAAGGRVGGLVRSYDFT